MSALDLLHRAAEIVESRRAAYGEPTEMFEAVAKRWSLVFGIEVTAAQVVIALLDLKLVRLCRDPRHLDSAVALAGYAAILRELTHDE